MASSSFAGWLSATAVSWTVAGNTGIAPFASLFIVGLIEKTNPDLLYMDGAIEWMLSSWASITILGILCVLEFVGKCVPVIDELIDSAITVVVPVFSVLGSLSTFGLFNVPSSSTLTDDFAMSDVDNGDEQDDGGRRRHLASIASGTLVFFQVIVVLIGILLALSLHGLKMIIRLVGEGCLTNCITVMEYTWIAISITLAIFIRQVAICIAVFFCLVAAYVIKRRYLDRKSIEDIAKADGVALARSASVSVFVTVSDDRVDVDQTSQQQSQHTQRDFVRMSDEEQQQVSAPYQSSVASF